VGEVAHSLFPLSGAKLDRSLEMVDGKIKEMHDYHKRVSVAVTDSASVAEAVH